MVPAQDEQGQALRRALAEAELLNAIAVAASTEEELAGILGAALNHLRHLVAFTGGSIALVEGTDLVIRAAVGPFAKAAMGHRLPRNDGPSWQVVKKAHTFLSNDLAAGGRKPTTPVRSFLAVPLLWRGAAYGLLEVDSTEPGAFADDDVRLLQRVAAAVGGPIKLAERREAEQRARHLLEEAVRARDVFVGVAAHELKTPVTSVRGYSQLVLRSLDRTGTIDAARLRQAMEIIDGQGEKLGRLITQLLDTSRIDAGRFSLDVEPTDLSKLVEETVAAMRPRTGRRPVRVTSFPTDPPSGAFAIEGDPLRLGQVLQNLVENAVKFSPPDAPIDVELRDEGETGVQLAVRDHGAGVPPDQREHLFRRFYQAHGEGYREGMGLGLYLSRAIVERHGGRIEAEFPEDGGTRFVVTLPRATPRGGVPPDAARETRAAPSRRPGPEPPAGDLEAQVEERTAELTRSNRDLEQFAYAASHDLQEPLRMVVNYLQLLERRYRGRLDADADEFINYAVDGARRMQRLINDLLAYSRVGRAGGKLEEVDVEALVDRVAGGLEPAIAEAGSRVTRDALPRVRADESQLGQLFQNLIGNAVKFRGDAPPLVHVSATVREDETEFAVRDNGMGIAPEYHQRIFEVFQRLHGKLAFPGTGIGLALCKKIVEWHGGRIWVDSRPGKGSTFRFTLPREPHPPPGTTTREEQP